MKDPRIIRLLEESSARTWGQDRDTGRAAFDRVKLIRSQTFARSETHKLRDLLPAARRDTALQ